MSPRNSARIAALALCLPGAASAQGWPAVNLNVPAGRTAIGVQGFVTNNTALKAVKNTDFPEGVRRLGFTVAGDGGSATYYWSAANCPAADDGAQVQPSVTGCWIADFSGTMPTPKIWGAKGDGIINDAGVVQACLNYAADGGTCWLPKGGRYDVSGGITIPRAATLDCGRESLADLTPPLLANSNWGPALLVAPTKPILFNHSSRLQNCLVVPVGMVFPQTSSAAWTGTAIDTNGGVNPKIVNTAIVGFDTCITTDTNGGSQRPYIAQVYADCTGVTRGSIVTGNFGDIATVQDVKLQTLGTSPTCPNRLRAGTGLKLVSFAFADNVVAMDFQKAAVDIESANQIAIGKLWIDYDTNGGCARGASVGVYISSVNDLYIAHLDIQGVQNGMQIVSQGGASVHIDDLWLNTIGNDGVQLGDLTSNGGILQIDQIRTNGAGSSVGGYAVNVLDNSHNSYIQINGGSIWGAHGGVAPYISVGGETAAHVHISDQIVTDLTDPYKLWGAPTLTNCTGLGATGGCSFLGSFRTTPWSGVVVLAPQSGATGSGEVSINWPVPFNNASGCLVTYKSGTVGWTPAAPLQAVDQTTSQTKLLWQGSMTAGQTYHIVFDCKPQ